MKVLCPFCHKKINPLARVCPYCTSKLEGTKQWEQTKKINAWLVLIGILIVIVMIAYSNCQSKSPKEVKEDPRLSGLIESFQDSQLRPFEFSKDDIFAEIMKKGIIAAGIECDVTGGKIYPFVNKQGFESDVNCANGQMHSVNYSKGRSTRLYVDGNPITTPEGW